MSRSARTGLATLLLTASLSWAGAARGGDMPVSQPIPAPMAWKAAGAEGVPFGLQVPGDWTVGTLPRGKTGLLVASPPSPRPAWCQVWANALDTAGADGVQDSDEPDQEGIQSADQVVVDNQPLVLTESTTHVRAGHPVGEPWAGFQKSYTAILNTRAVQYVFECHTGGPTQAAALQAWTGQHEVLLHIIGSIAIHG